MIDEELRILSKCKSIKLTEIVQEYQTLQNGFDKANKMIQGFEESNNNDNNNNEIKETMESFQSQFSNLKNVLENLKLKGENY